jgi:hypothetical protein
MGKSKNIGRYFLSSTVLQPEKVPMDGQGGMIVKTDLESKWRASESQKAKKLFAFINIDYNSLSIYFKAPNRFVGHHLL